MSIAASSTDIYATTQDDELYDINAVTGAIKHIVTTAGFEAIRVAGSQLIGLGYDTSTNQNYLASIDPATGASTLLSSFTSSSGYWWPATFVANATDVYLVSTSDDIYDFDATTGAIKSVEPLTTALVEGLALPPSSPLFTAGADIVDFNNLTPAQDEAIADGADIYDGLGGADVVTLPSVLNYNESVGSGTTLGWTNTSASTFHTDSCPGDTYTISGTDGDYFIDEGAGTEYITIVGGGSSTITAGSGNDTSP